jgi:hypothetical protein
MGWHKNRFGVITWNNRRAMLPKGKSILHHLVGRYYIARIGYGSLLNLDYCVFFERLSGRRGSITVYNLLKKNYASNVVRTKIHSMKRGILNVLTRKMSLRILLRQIPKSSATNIPAHRYDYQLVAVCLVGVNGDILDIDAKSHPDDQY